MLGQHGLVEQDLGMLVGTMSQCAFATKDNDILDCMWSVATWSKEVIFLFKSALVRPCLDYCV